MYQDIYGEYKRQKERAKNNASGAFVTALACNYYRRNYIINPTVLAMGIYVTGAFAFYSVVAMNQVVAIRRSTN